MADVALRSSWLGTWTRAVVGPASRRATAVWIGAGLVVAVIFGGNGMKPHDLTQLALRVPAVGAVLAVTWSLLFLPTARVLVRADGASYLRSLPGSRAMTSMIAILAMLALQLPWLALWVVGEGARGFAIVIATSLVLAVIAAWRPRPRRSTRPAWRSAHAALGGVYARALRRRAGDALVRGAGLAVLAGIAGGLLVRNNALVGREAAVLGTGVIEIVLVPAWVGVLLPLLDAHRASGWLASSLGISERARIAVLAAAVIVVYLIAAAIAACAAVITLGGMPSQESPSGTIGWIAGLSLAIAACSGLLQTRALVWAERSEHVAARVVSGALVVAAVSIGCLGVLGASGVLALAATAVVAIGTVRA